MNKKEALLMRLLCGVVFILSVGCISYIENKGMDQFYTVPYVLIALFGFIGLIFLWEVL